MKFTRTADSVFVRQAAEVEPWHPEPDRSVRYADDEAWQRAHLWDSMHEGNQGFHGPWRGPNITHHPDYQYALDNGWRAVGGPSALNHQSRGEAGSGHPYLYKISRDGTIHEMLLGHGPEDAHSEEMEDAGAYGDVPEHNYRHLIYGEGTILENPKRHATLRDLVDDEQFRSSDPTHKGYGDFKELPGYRDLSFDEDWRKRMQHTMRRAWETGSNQPDKHFNDPIPDPYEDIDKIPRSSRPEPGPREDYGDLGGSKHPRYGASDDPTRE